MSEGEELVAAIRRVYDINRLVVSISPEFLANGAMDIIGFDKEIERAEEEAQDDVETVLISDEARLWIVNFCDKCGELWLSSDPDDPDVARIFENMRDGDGRSNAAMWGARQRMPWAEISNRLKSAFDFALVYEDGVWLQPRKQRLFERNVMRLTHTKPLPPSRR